MVGICLNVKKKKKKGRDMDISSSAIFMKNLRSFIGSSAPPMNSANEIICVCAGGRFVAVI